MKPFDLEAAMRGEPVVTRDKREVLELTHLKSADDWPLVGTACGETAVWKLSGKYGALDYESRYDLFMATKKRKVRIRLYRTTLDPKIVYAMSEDSGNLDGECSIDWCDPQRTRIRCEWVSPIIEIEVDE